MITPPPVLSAAIKGAKLSRGSTKINPRFFHFSRARRVLRFPPNLLRCVGLLVEFYVVTISNPYSSRYPSGINRFVIAKYSILS